jgi:ABC-type dipeptide/oligopeptide/nickel transport system permease component
VIVLVFVFVNTIVDVLYAVLDPRVSLGSRAQ